MHGIIDNLCGFDKTNDRIKEAYLIINRTTSLLVRGASHTEASIRSILRAKTAPFNGAVFCSDNLRLNCEGS